MRWSVALALVVALAGAERAAAAPQCIGAAARDPWRSCANPERWLTVYPSPAEAQRVGNLPCASFTRSALLFECRFGEQESPSASVALVGDSHASHWRTALDVVAKRRGWQRHVAHAHALLVLSCAQGPSGARARAVRRVEPPSVGVAPPHPEVSMVFVSGISGGVGVVTEGDQLAAQASGYLAAWRALPRTVERIVVIRDTPKMRTDTTRCVTRAMAARRDAGAACAVPRAGALIADAATTAARRWHSKRVRIVDLTPWMCDPSRCFPVIGGVLVFRDKTHLTRAFSETLAPYLERRFERAE